VLEELERAGVARDGEGQMKIHSKIVQGADGHLYFASMDEQGEKSDGSRLPTWGSHLWRLRLPENKWEHLLAAPEALIAVASAPRHIYALGYFGHVLYQFDTQTGNVRSVRVGSVGGHISRNFLADARGHAYVPRLKKDADKVVATLVELDTELKELRETPLQHYSTTTSDDSHGIVGVQPLADRSLAFVTDRGCLYRIEPAEGGGAATVEELGLFHPKGEAYVASLYTFDGEKHLMGLSRRQWNNDNRYEWLVYDLTARKAVALPVELPAIDGKPMDGLLYGSTTRDDDGNAYLVGTYHRNSRDWPLVLHARLPR
jgi:hypothetical protein